MINIKDGRGPLLLACSAGNENITRRLVLAGADVDVQAEDGMTCLMCACQFGWIRVTEELLSRGCQIHRAMMVGILQ